MHSSIKVIVFVCFCCYNKISQAGWKFVLLQFWRLEVHKLGVGMFWRPHVINQSQVSHMQGNHPTHNTITLVPQVSLLLRVLILLNVLHSYGVLNLYFHILVGFASKCKYTGSQGINILICGGYRQLVLEKSEEHSCGRRVTQATVNMHLCFPCRACLGLRWDLGISAGIWTSPLLSFIAASLYPLPFQFAVPLTKEIRLSLP